MQNTTQHLEQKINKAREIDQDDNEDDEEEDDNRQPDASSVGQEADQTSGYNTDLNKSVHFKDKDDTS